MKNIKKTFYFIILMLVFIAALALRVKMYLFAKPLWNDECALALNLTPFGLLNCFKELSSGQATPPLFLFISGLFYKTNFMPEFSLRFLPLLSSLLSIFTFYLLTKNILNKKITVIFAAILFCFNFQLIYYSAEFKQYSTDILLFTGLLASYFYLNIKSASIKKLCAIGCSYALCVWFSFVSVFAVFSIFAVALAKNIKEYKKIIICSIPVIISFVAFFLNQHHLATSNFLHNYWKDGFIKYDLSNFATVFLNYFIFAFNNLLLLMLFIIGLILNLIKIKQDKSQLLIMPIIIAVALSCFSIYPLSSRVSLYLIPVFIIIMAKILDYINFKKSLINYAISFLIMFLSGFIIIINTTNKVSSKDFVYEDILTPLKTAEFEMKPNDILYIPDGSEISYNFYKKYFHFKNVIVEKQRINNEQEYMIFLDKLPKGSTYYYIFCHFPQKQERLKSIYLWAKNKKDFKINADKSLNAMIRFTK